MLKEIIDEIERGYKGDPWHGPSLLALLEHIDHHESAVAPIAGAHTIAQIVLHIASWKEIVAERLGTREAIVVNPERDWPQAVINTAADWQAALRRLDSAERNLVRAIAAFDPDRLAEVVPGKHHPFVVEIRGLPQHDAYHGGQIAILKRAHTPR